MPRTKTRSPPTASTDEGPSFFVTTSRVIVSCCPRQTPRCPATRPTGTGQKQQGCLITPWGCWSATQRRSSGCCRSHNPTFGLETAEQYYTAGASLQEEGRHSTDTKATAEMNVSTQKSNSLFFTHRLSNSSFITVQFKVNGKLCSYYFKGRFRNYVNSYLSLALFSLISAIQRFLKPQSTYSLKGSRQNSNTRQEDTFSLDCPSSSSLLCSLQRKVNFSYNLEICPWLSHILSLLKQLMITDPAGM